MIRILTGILLSAVMGAAAFGQSRPTPAPQQLAASPQPPDWLQDKAEVQRQIDLREAEVRTGEAAHADRERLAANYSALAFLYMDAGMGLKAEDAFQRAIALLKDGPQDQLANEVEQLGVLQIGMGKFGRAEKDERQVLAIRQALRDPVGTALAESNIAGIYAAEKKFAKARDYAEKAYDALASRTDVSVPDRIGVSHTLGFALTGLRECDRGIGVLKDALEMARTKPGWGDASLGYSEYMLGIGYWHCQDRDHAAVWLERGTTDLSAEFGWSHATYVYAMKQYALFLRQDGQAGSAASAEAVVQQAESVIGADTLTGRTQTQKASEVPSGLEVRDR
jgi:tetratricopeptide (TPR) repeat protein